MAARPGPGGSGRRGSVLFPLFEDTVPKSVRCAFLVPSATSGVADRRRRLERPASALL